ncbi:aldehyde dehydrogenase family protein, partial [Mycolicibacterium grossiae]
MELTVLDPRTGEVVSRVDVAGPEACDAAVDAARGAAEAWARTAPAERA